MTRSRVLLAVLVLFLTTGVALASGSSRRPAPSSQLDSFSTVETIEVTIVAVEEGNVLVLQADEGAPQARIEIANGAALPVARVIDERRAALAETTEPDTRKALLAELADLEMRLAIEQEIRRRTFR